MEAAGLPSSIDPFLLEWVNSNIVRPKANQITDLADCVVLARIFETISPKSKAMLKEVKAKSIGYNSDILYAAIQEFVQTKGAKVLPPDNFLDFDLQTETFCRHLVVYVLICALQSDKKRVFLANIKESFSDKSLQGLTDGLKVIKADVLLKDAVDLNVVSSETSSPQKSKPKKQVSFGGTQKLMLDLSFPVSQEGNVPPKLKKLMERLRQNQPPLNDEEKEAISVSGLMEGYVKSVDGFHYPQKEIENLLINKPSNKEEVSTITTKITQHSNEVRKLRENLQQENRNEPEDSKKSNSELLRILEFYEKHLEKVISKLEEKPSIQTQSEKSPSFLLGAVTMMFCLVCILVLLDYSQFTRRQHFVAT